MVKKIVRFYIADVYTTVMEACPEAKAIIHDVCRARPKGYQFMPKYKSRRWDGYISLTKGGDKLVPTGLLRTITTALLKANMRCFYSYSRSKLTRKGKELLGASVVPDCLVDETVLRDYQLDAVKVLLDKERGIARMATNAGKTVVFAALIKLLNTTKVTVIVQSLDLLYQTSSRLAKMLGINVGVIGDGKHSNASFRVATIQTLGSMYKRLGPSAFKRNFHGNKILVVDECHHIGHNKTFDVLMEIPGWYRFGFSGTPLDRGDLNDLKLMACTGPVQVNLSNAELIDAGWSAKPTIHVHEYNPLSMLSTGARRGTPEYDNVQYMTAYKEFITLHAPRNKAIVETAKDIISRSKSALVIVKHICHGDTITSMLHDAGLDPVFVNGSSSVSERMAVLNMLGSGGANAVVATNIFDEGVDVPALDSVVLACGGKSHVALLQRIGRVLRKKSGVDAENVLEVHDFMDVDNAYMEEHYRGRIRVYANEGFETKHVKINQK